MKKLSLLMVLMLTTALISFGQKDETLAKQIRITGAWGGNTWAVSQLGEQNAVFSTGYGGLEIGKNLFVGWGGGNLINEVQLDQLSNDRYDMSYNGLILGYGIKSYKSIHPQFMMMAGGGNVRIENGGREGFYMVQPSVGLEFNVTRWFRIGAHGGYRMITDTELTGTSNSELSNAFAEVRFKFGWSWGK